MKEKQNSGLALTEAAQNYMKDHSAEKFSLKKMASALYVNGSYLLRTFKLHTGITPLVYHHCVRCDKAKQLLTQTNLSISQIGETVGFISSSHFSHIFRQMEGCSPSEYRMLYNSNTHGGTEP